MSADYIVLRIRTALLDLFSGSYASAIIEMNNEMVDYILSNRLLSNDAKLVWKDKRIYLIPHKTFHIEYFVVHGDNSTVLELPDSAVLLF